MYKEIKDLSEIEGQAEKLLGQVEEKEVFEIDNESKASWALRKLRELQEEEDKVKEIYNSEKAYIDEWKNKEFRKIESSREYFENGLKLYFEEQRGLDPNFKLSTPNGNLGTRKRTKWEYNDKELVEWLENANKLDLLNSKPRKSDVKKAFKRVGDSLVDAETGEIVAGVTVKEEENFNITIRRK